MVKRCPFICNSETKSNSGTTGNLTCGYSVTISFGECHEEQCQAWDVETKKCLRMNFPFPVEKSTTNPINQIEDAVDLTKSLTKSPCGADTCSECPDYGYANEYPCLDWSDAEIQHRKMYQKKKEGN